MNESSGHAADEAAVVVDDQANLAIAKGKQKVGETSGPTASASPRASSTLSVKDTEVEVEDPTADLVSREKCSKKRKTPFSLGRPFPKLPQVVEFIDFSFGGEDTDDQTRGETNGYQVEETNVPPPKP